MSTFKIRPAICLFYTCMLFLVSCNSNTETAKEDTKKTTDSATVSTPPPPPPAPVFKPFDIAEIGHSVKDFAKWRPFFDADSVNRKANGLDQLVVGQKLDNPNAVFIVFNAADVQKAKDFTNNPKLKETMTKAGVLSKPEISFFHVIRFNAESKEKQWVVVTHKVKDFDAWLKVYDGEGKDQRAKEGMVDVALARGIDDPNNVQIVFDITDLTKAKAAITSEDKKKLMMSAGVLGKPTIAFYHTAE